jgi:hypothetical protein
LPVHLTRPPARPGRKVIADGDLYRVVWIE